MKQVIKTAGDKAKQAAATTAKQIAQEFIEIPKQAAQEAVGVKAAVSPNPSEQNVNSGLQAYDPNKKQEEVKQRLDYLEKELEELKRKREMEKEQAQYAEMQRQKQEEEERQKKMAEILAPPKKKLRMPGFGQKKTKGTGEKLKSSK